MWGYLGGSSLWDSMSPYRNSPYAPSAPDEPALLSSISQLSPEDRERLKKMGMMGMGGKFADALAVGQQTGGHKGTNKWVAALVAGLGTGFSAYMDSKGEAAALETEALDKANRAALQDYGIAREKFRDDRAEFGITESLRKEQEKEAEARAKQRAEALEALKAKQRMEDSLRRLGAPEGVDANSPEAKIVLDQLARQAVKPKSDDRPVSTARGLGYVRDGKFVPIPGTEPIRQPPRGRDPEVEAERDYNSAAAAIDRRITTIAGKQFQTPEDKAFLASVGTPEQKRAAIEAEATLRQRGPQKAAGAASLGLKPGDPDFDTAENLLKGGMSLAEVKKLLEEARRVKSGRQ